MKKLRDDYQVKQSEDLRVAGLDRVQAYPFESRDGDYGALCLFVGYSCVVYSFKNNYEMMEICTDN